LTDENHRADGRDCESHAEAPDPELVVGIDRDDGKEHPHGQAECELCEHREHERLRQDAVLLHLAIQANRACQA
jgi:hypothetical protein